MKKAAFSLWVVLSLLLIAVFAYAMGTAQAKALEQTGEANRWHIVAHYSDAGKTFLVDSATGEAFILTSAGDSHNWKKIERK